MTWPELLAISSIKNLSCSFLFFLISDVTITESQETTHQVTWNLSIKGIAPASSAGIATESVACVLQGASKSNRNS